MDEYMKLFIIIVLLVVSMVFLMYYDTLTSIIMAFVMLVLCSFIVSYYF